MCGKSCPRCTTRKKTRIVTLRDFLKDQRSFTCQCKVWGEIAVRSDKIILEKACKYTINIASQKNTQTVYRQWNPDFSIL